MIYVYDLYGIYVYISIQKMRKCYTYLPSLCDRKKKKKTEKTAKGMRKN